MQIREPSHDERQLFDLACSAQRTSYHPHSRFRVGAALRTHDGQIHTGTNIDNASYPVSVCAEVSAVSAAVTQGAKRIETVAVVGEADSVSPCGQCRQLLSEFATSTTTVVYRWQGEMISVPLTVLLPHGFELR
ncbi:cytidine deaminase [Sciscionella marina]|uniref:cytidine deaminase n=1 Tax=Sciscionella marina TaxID=508770 RepID=UPI00036DE4A6|nr:cytidine deaminase [Sciscionella marina]